MHGPLNVKINVQDRCDWLYLHVKNIWGLHEFSS